MQQLLKGDEKMVKEYKNLEEILKLPVLNTEGKTSIVFKDKDSIIKLYEPTLLQIEKTIGLDTEKKILASHYISELPELNTPTSAIYDKRTNRFIASRSPYIEGKNYNQIYTDSLTDITKPCNLHIRLENFLQRADKYNIVLPDYGSLNNLIIDKNNNFHFIDYDGIQINEHRSLAVSSSISTPLIQTSKYYNNNFFTPELNILSHYVILLLDIVNANLLTVGKKTPNGVITLDDFFNTIGLDNYDIQNKIWKLFQQNKKNEYLGEDLINLQENYKTVILGKYKNYPLKRLVRK